MRKGDTRYKEVRLSKELLGQFLRGEARVTSDAPDDLEVIHVYEPSFGCPEYEFRVIVHSKTFHHVTPAHNAPVLEITFTRESGCRCNCNHCSAARVGGIEAAEALPTPHHRCAFDEPDP